jgi:lysozyme family protein
MGVNRMKAKNTNELVSKQTPRFKRLVSSTITLETGGDKNGGYTNDPDDSGGATKWGISQKAFPDVDIKALTYKDAVEIYFNIFWNPLYDFIPDEVLAFKIFDLGVLFGKKAVVRNLQRALLKYKTLAIDGVFGPMTLTAVITCIAKGELIEVREDFLHRMRNRVFWLTLVKNWKYKKGWLNRINYPYVVRIL